MNTNIDESWLESILALLACVLCGAGLISLMAMVVA